MSNESNTALSSTSYFWLHLAMLASGIAGLALAHRVADWTRDGSSIDVMTRTSVTAVVSLVVVARATFVLVSAASSDAHRVFRARHLLACAVLLLLPAVGTTAALLFGAPLEQLLSHGQITGGDIADVATGVAAVICGVGALMALVGSWDARHAERHWHRSLHLPHRREP